MAYKLENASILIVDDMSPMLQLVEAVLKSFGFDNIRTTSNGKNAFDLICRHDPDLIITDWVMEPMDGLELTRLVRKSPMAPNPYVPILIMTGFSARARVEAARDQGMTEFLVKPFTARDLYARVEQIIERPRQFVEADEFFGPDRRRRSDDRYGGPERRERREDTGKKF